jgi:hypothetical protein
MTPTDHDPAPDPFAEEVPADPHPHARPDRQPCEAIFAVVMLLASLVFFWSAFGISGFEALSAPGSVPMATTAMMAASAFLMMPQTFRIPSAKGESFVASVLCPRRSS